MMALPRETKCSKTCPQLLFSAKKSSAISIFNLEMNEINYFTSYKNRIIFSAIDKQTLQTVLLHSLSHYRNIFLTLNLKHLT